MTDGGETDDGARPAADAVDPTDGASNPDDPRLGSLERPREETGTFDPRGDWGRVLAIAALAVVPWTVIGYAGEFDLVFAWGLVNTEPPSAVDLWSYLFEHTMGPRQLPSRLLAWPLGTVLYAGALTSAAVGAGTGHEDWRITAALLGCAAIANVRFTLGITAPTATAIPLGALGLLVVGWWYYWPVAVGERWIGRG